MTRRACMIDGKQVRNYLFAHLLRRNVAGRRETMNVQVEAFNVDHAVQRLRARWPMLRDWHMIEELDPEHDIGMVGERLPLNPLESSARRLQ